MPDRLPLVQFARDFWPKLKDDKVFTGAAALAFYLTLAIFPAMIVTMAVSPYLPVAQVDQAVMDLLHQVMPGDAAQVFTGVVADVTSERRGGLLSFITYDVGEGRSFLRARATALGLSLMLIVLVLGSLSLVVLGGVIQDWIGARWGYSSPLLTFFAVLRCVVVGIGLILAFALINGLIPASGLRQCASFLGCRNARNYLSTFPSKLLSASRP